MTALTMSPRARKRMVNRGLDVLTWLVLLVMLAPFLWLLISSRAGRPRAVYRRL